jgi:hypothetical protein
MNHIPTYKNLFESIQKKMLKENIATYAVKGVIWDADEVEWEGEELEDGFDLPTDVEVDIDMSEFDHVDPDEHEELLTELISDALSDTFGFTHYGWDDHKLVKVLPDSESQE